MKVFAMLDCRLPFCGGDGPGSRNSGSKSWFGFEIPSSSVMTERPIASRHRATRKVRIVKNGELQPKPFLDIRRRSIRGEKGLLGLAFHPDFEKNGL